MNKKIMFNAPMKICFGENAINDLEKEIVGDKVFIVMDRFLYNSELRKKLENILENKEIEYFIEFTPNPDIADVDKGLNRVREFAATTVIGIGGGSTLDISKFLAVSIMETKTVDEIRKSGFTVENKIKSICIPTTSGTGSEVTNVSVFSDYHTKTKSPFVNDMLFADVALLDSELTVSLPPQVTASCGMDTFCHAIEAYWNVNSNEMSDLFAVEAMDLVLHHLQNCYTEGNNLKERTDLLKASLYAGLAFSQTRTTILHAISFPLTSKYGVPHGLACAIMLPSFIRYYGEGNEKMRYLSNKLGYKDKDELALAIDSLMKSLNMKRTLIENGVKKSDVEMIAKEALKEKIALLGPKEVSLDTLINLLEGAYK